MVVVGPIDNGKNSQEHMDYESEKELEKYRIGEGTKRLINNYKNNWDKQYKNVPVFPRAISGLNQNILKILLSIETSKVYDNVGKKFELSRRQRNLLPAAVWEIVITRKFAEAKEFIGTNLEIPQDKLTTLYAEMEKEIFGKITKMPYQQRSVENEAPQQNKIEMPIKAAMKKYSSIGEQFVTSAPLKVSFFPTPVKPSIKNWLMDYNDSMGTGKHGTLERGNYLFNSSNSKNLSVRERQHLAEILKSYDEDSDLAIDVENQKVIFSERKDSDDGFNQNSGNEERGGIKKSSNSMNYYKKSQDDSSETPSKWDPTKAVRQQMQNEENATVKFSSPHTFSHEKEKKREDNGNIKPYKLSKDFSHITPINRPNNKNGSEGIEPRLDGNTVDLSGN